MRFAVNCRFQIELSVAERQVCGRIADFPQVIQMTVRMARFAFSRIAEVSGDFRIPFDVRDLCKVQVPAIRHRFTGKCVFQVLVSLASLQFCHRIPLSSCVKFPL